MSDEIIRWVHIDTRFDSYRNFFSDDWGKRIDALTKDIPKLSPLVFDVMMEWRAAAYTASLPVSILEHMKAFHDGFVRTGEINTTLLRLMEIVPGALARKIPELTTDPSLMRRIQKELVEIGATMEENRDPSGFEFPLDETWNSYLNERAYQLSLWGSQRICYVSIYNSYENFLVRCVGIAKKIEGCARHISTHAAGVLISPSRIDDYTPVQFDKDGKIITQYDMYTGDRDGVVNLPKFDILGIKNLSILANSIKLVEKLKDTKINLDEINKIIKNPILMLSY